MHLKTINDFLKDNSYDTILLSLVLNKSKAYIFAHGDYKLSTAENRRLHALIAKTKQGVPFPYLSGIKGFYHLNFKVTTATLIPRVETELIIDIVLALFSKKQSFNVLDLGTGSGNIAITIADKFPNWNITATDICKKALDIAKQNSTKNIIFKQGNWFLAVPRLSFDLVIANPPYVEKNSPYLDDLSYEPQGALVAGKDGLDAIKIIINDAPKHLNKNGYLLLEHGYKQQLQIEKLLVDNFYNIRKFYDYNNIGRAIISKLK